MAKRTDNPSTRSEKAAEDRREFLKKAGLTAAAAPAATLLLSAKAKRAQAIPISGFSDETDDGVSS